MDDKDDESEREEVEEEEDSSTKAASAHVPVVMKPAPTKPKLNVSFSDSDDDEIPDDAVRNVMKATKTFDDLFGEPDGQSPKKVVFNKDSDESDTEVSVQQSWQIRILFLQLHLSLDLEYLYSILLSFYYILVRPYGTVLYSGAYKTLNVEIIKWAHSKIICLVFTFDVRW